MRATGSVLVPGRRPDWRSSSGADADRANRTPVVHYPATAAVNYSGGELGFLVELLRDPSIARYEPLSIPLGQPGAIELVAAFVDKQVSQRTDGTHPWAPASTQGWVLVEGERRVGVCQLRPDGQGCLVGASLFAEVRNRGLGTAVFAALGVFGLGFLGAGHVAGEVEDDNLASIRALEKAGYRRIDRHLTTLDNGRQTMVSRYVA